MNENNEKILQSYKRKILGIRNYKSDKKEFNTDDFTNLKKLGEILNEIDTGESDITPAGKLFLEEYYGFKDLAQLLISEGVLVEPLRNYSLKKLNTWLESLRPMETISFIEESRGTIKDGQDLREDLLPPKED